MKKILISFIPILLMVSCTRYAYFQSPLHNNTSPYRAIPPKSEHRPSAIYANGTLTSGGANQALRDGFTAFLGSVHRSHNFGHFQAYYGLQGSLGRYKVGRVNSPSRRDNNENLNASLINTRGGSKFFGSWGGLGGANVVMPMKKGGEWRVIGFEASWNNEFGQYLDFRQGLPDTAANLIDRNRHFLTLGVNTDIIVPVPKGFLGYKMAVVWNPRRLRGFDKVRRPENHGSTYLSQTLHLTVDRFTGFVQGNIGSFSIGYNMGLNIRLGKKKAGKAAGL